MRYDDWIELNSVHNLIRFFACQVYIYVYHNIIHHGGFGQYEYSPEVTIYKSKSNVANVTKE